MRLADWEQQCSVGGRWTSRSKSELVHDNCSSIALPAGPTCTRHAHLSIATSRPPRAARLIPFGVRALRGAHWPPDCLGLAGSSLRAPRGPQDQRGRSEGAHPKGRRAGGSRGRRRAPTQIWLSLVCLPRSAASEWRPAWREPANWRPAAREQIKTSKTSM